MAKFTRILSQIFLSDHSTLMKLDFFTLKLTFLLFPLNSITFKIYQSILYSTKYCVINNYWESSDEYINSDHITLVLHSTPPFLNYLTEHVNTWNGSISLSLFIPTPDKNDKDLIDFKSFKLHLQVCFL